MVEQITQQRTSETAMHHRIDFMLALIDLSVIFIVAGCLLYQYFRWKKEPFLADTEDDNEIGATPAGSDARTRMVTRAAAAVDH